MAVASDVTFTVAGCDGDGGGGRFAGEAGCGAGGGPHRLPAALLLRLQRTHRALREDLLL